MKNKSQLSEVRSRRTENRSQKSEVRKTQKILLSLIGVLSSVLCLLPSASADEISAKAAVVIDAATDKILYAKNPNSRLLPASTTKLVTAIVVLDKINPETVVTVSETAANVPSVSPHLRHGEKYTVRDLLHLALMRSINGATVALAEAVAGSEDAFAAMMNEKVARIGADNSRFINASGLPGPNQHVTAYDLVRIMKESLKYPLIREIINTRTKNIYTQDGRKLFVKNTNQLLWSDEDLLGGKTGYTKAARHCFVCAAQKGQNTLITAVLGESVRDNLWEDTNRLLSKGYDVLTDKSEPVIYFSKVSSEPSVVFASYKADKSRAKHKKKRSRHAKIAKNTVDEQDGKSDAAPAKKKSKTKKHKQGKGAKKGKKASGKRKAVQAQQ